MKTNGLAILFLLSSILVAPMCAQVIGGGNCDATNLAGSYSLTLSGRAISSNGAFAGSYQGVGSATFDGQGNVTLAGIANTNLAQGQQFSYSGTYSVPNNCYGTLMVTTNSTAQFALVVWSGGKQFNIIGSDNDYVYSGSGANNQPACGTPTLSGEYIFTASGFTLSGSTQNGAQDEAGVLVFDGQGNVSATYTDTQSGMTPVAETGTGTYTVSAFCSASASWTDSSGLSNTLNFVILGLHGENLDVLSASSQYVRTGSAHSAFVNPSQAIGNVASYAYSATPAGSVFAIFGENLASKADSTTSTPLPTQLLNTTVTVNGELAPLFFVDTGQIDAQMPWDIPGDSVASVVVTNGDATSNAAAVYVPANGTPGISVYANNRAVVVNEGGSVNSGSAPARVGDEVVLYFTGGGPVNASGNLVTGSPSPSGLSPVSGSNPTVTVGGQSATVKYMGLTPGSIGLYQTNFIVPQLDNGTYVVIISIDGVASNTLGGPNPRPVMTIVEWTTSQAR